MNKAFVREPDSDSGRCPRCDSPGQSVGVETLTAWVPAEHRGDLASSAYFCPYAKCPVVYFDSFERVVEQDVIARPIYPKDPTAPLCGCSGLTLEDIEADLAEGAPTRTRKAIELAKSPDARCVTLNPSGHSCVADVQRCYLQRKGS